MSGCSQTPSTRLQSLGSVRATVGALPDPDELYSNRAVVKNSLGSSALDGVRPRTEDCRQPHYDRDRACVRHLVAHHLPTKHWVRGPHEAAVSGEGTRPASEKRDIVALVGAAQQGDLMAMEELLGLLVPYIGRLTGPIALDDGPDAAQEALSAIFRNLRHLRDPAALYSWARAIAVREAVRFARAAARSRPAELTEVPVRGDPQLAVDIRDVLTRLSPEHRAVLLLRDLEGLDEQSAAVLLAVPTGTVKSRLSRARSRFREAWER